MVLYFVGMFSPTKVKWDLTHNFLGTHNCNLQGDQTLQMDPSLQMGQGVHDDPALQGDQRSRCHHGHHEDHLCQRDQQSQEDQQYPERGREQRCINFVCIGVNVCVCVYICVFIVITTNKR